MSYASEVLADSPLAYWKLDETSGESTLDSSPSGKHGSYGGTYALNQASLISDTSSRSVDFNGTSWVDTPSFGGGVEPVAAMTVTAWVKLDSLGAEQGIHARSSTVRDAFRFGVTSANKLKADIWNTSLTSVTGATSLGTGIHFVAFTYDSTNLRVFLDGAQDASVAASGNLAQHGGLLGGLIGAFYNGSALYAQQGGRLAHVAYYASALSPSRIAALYTAGTAAPGSLVATLAGTVPAPTAQLSGTATPPALTGTLAGTVPAPTAQLSGDVPGAPLTATLAGVVPAPTAQLTDGVVFEPFEEPRPGYGIRFGSSNVNSVKVSSVPPEELARLVPLGREAVEV